MLSDVRPTITVLVNLAPDDDLELLRATLKGSTIGLHTAEDRTITATGIKLETLKRVDSLPGIAKNPASGLVVIVISCPANEYRSN
jgi:hypothetical protein